MSKKFKRIPVEEFLFSEITVLESATLPNELLHSHFPKFLITIIEWYNGIVDHSTKISQMTSEEWREYIKRGIPKRGNKI